MMNSFLYIGDGGKNMNPVVKWIWSLVRGYNHEKYWKRREHVVSPEYKNKLWKLYCLFYVKRVDAKHHCSFGTEWNRGASFATPPHFPHGINGIIVGGDVVLGEHCIIYHQVTIAGGNVVVGNRVEFGAGAKVLPNVKIGNYCKVGANAVVVEDMPDHSTCVMQKPRIIVKRKTKDE